MDIKKFCPILGPDLTVHKEGKTRQRAWAGKKTTQNDIHVAVSVYQTVNFLPTLSGNRQNAGGKQMETSNERWKGKGKAKKTERAF